MEEIGLGGDMVMGSGVSRARNSSKPEKALPLSEADVAGHLPSICEFLGSTPNPKHRLFIRQKNFFRNLMVVRYRIYI